MEQLLNKIKVLKEEITAFNGGDAETFRIKYLGTKGLVKTIMGEMKNVAPENKKEAGQLLNEFKLFTEAKYNELNEASSKSEVGNPKSEIDLTLPGDKARACCRRCSVWATPGTRYSIWAANC